MGHGLIYCLGLISKVEALGPKGQLGAEAGPEMGSLGEPWRLPCGPFLPMFQRALAVETETEVQERGGSVDVLPVFPAAWFHHLDHVVVEDPIGRVHVAQLRAVNHSTPRTRSHARKFVLEAAMAR